MGHASQIPVFLEAGQYDPPHNPYQLTAMQRNICRRIPFQILGQNSTKMECVAILQFFAYGFSLQTFLDELLRKRNLAIFLAAKYLGLNDGLFALIF